MRNLLLLAVVMTIIASPAPADAPNEVVSGYFRPDNDKFTEECTITIQRRRDGFDVVSRTLRGAGTLEIQSRYDNAAKLLDAKVELKEKDAVKRATVTVKKDRATIQREGQSSQEFDAPATIIVTSAPDWTDTFLLCERYQDRKAGVQEFPALWIHPTQPAQRLTFSAQAAGADVIQHEGKELKLRLLKLRIRNNSEYLAWVNDEGRMIKLVPLPFKPEAKNWLVLEGYQKSAAELEPKK